MGREHLIKRNGVQGGCVGLGGRERGGLPYWSTLWYRRAPPLENLVGSTRQKKTVTPCAFGKFNKLLPSVQLDRSNTSSLICMFRSVMGALIRWDWREASNAPISVAHRPLSAGLPLAEAALVQVSVGVFPGAHTVLKQVDPVQYVVMHY